jgi:hypothetical protein
MKTLLASKGELAGGVTAEGLRDSGLFLCGSPATLRERFATFAKRYGIGNWVLMLQFGTLPADLTAKNMELFAREVMPALKPAVKAAPRAAE